MTLWFVFLLVLAHIKILGSPFFLVGKKTLFFGMFCIGIWLILGAAQYTLTIQKVEKEKQALLAQQTQLQSEKEAFKKLEKDHPTSRDVLVALTSLSYQLNETNDFLSYRERLQEIDPTHPLVKKLLSIEKIQ